MGAAQSVLLDIGYALAGLAFLPVVIYRAIFAGRYRHGWGSRFGAAPRRHTDRPCIWIHAVSVGEVNAIRTLVERLRQQFPGHEILISTTTDTGFDRAAAVFGRDRVFFFPFDFSWVMRRAFDRLRPSAVLLVELEVWPNLVAEATRRSVPVAVVNGRITERSLRRYRLAGPLVRRLFQRIDLVMVQDEIYRRRFLEIGAPADRIVETGSLKWDTAKPEQGAGGEEALSAIAEALGLERGKPIMVAGSTAETVEEEAIVRAYQQARVRHADLQLVIAPRKPERFDQVARLIRSRGFKVVRRSEHPDGTRLERPGSLVASAVVLLDTIGELRRLYAMASVVVVGRTFVPLGGSDVMEIAALGKAMILGPHTENFADAVGKLLESEAAVQVDSAEKLAGQIERLLGDSSLLEEIGERARQVVVSQQGATDRTARHVCELLGYEFDATGRAVATPRPGAAGA